MRQKPAWIGISIVVAVAAAGSALLFGLPTVVAKGIGLPVEWRNPTLKSASRDELIVQLGEPRSSMILEFASVKPYESWGTGNHPFWSLQVRYRCERRKEHPVYAVAELYTLLVLSADRYLRGPILSNATRDGEDTIDADLCYDAWIVRNDHLYGLGRHP